jgi:hypothetical protein
MMDMIGAFHQADTFFVFLYCCLTCKCFGVQVMTVSTHLTCPPAARGSLLELYWLSFQFNVAVATFIALRQWNLSCGNCLSESFVWASSSIIWQCSKWMAGVGFCWLLIVNPWGSIKFRHPLIFLVTVYKQSTDKKPPNENEYISKFA